MAHAFPPSKLEPSLIVVSGALAVIAFVLLIAGLIADGLNLVYASIVVSAVAFVFLGIGAYQRRGEEVARVGEVALPAPVAAGGEELTRVIPVAGAGAAATTPPVFAATDDTADDAAGVAVVDEVEDAAFVDTDEEQEEFADSGGDEVLVVPGRPRYHIAGCRYLAGKDTESRSRTEALEEGFSACGVCRPDEALAAAPLASVTSLPTAPEPEPVEAEVDEVPVTARPGTRRTAATTGAAKKTATKTAGKAPAKTAAKTAAAPAAKKTAPASSSRGKVVVIPDRGKFHKADCRFVRDADATLELTKAAATKQGYVACGVCKP